jgi:hypothetical protein
MAVTPLALAALAGLAHAQPFPSAPRPTLVPGPGSGYRTPAPAMVRTLSPAVTVRPILTVGDTLAPNDPDEIPFVFYPLPDGLGVRAGGKGLVEVYVAHEIGWEEGVGGARVSRLILDKRNLGVLAGDWLVDGTEGYSRFCAASLVGPRDGFLTPTFLVNEESVIGIRRGIVAAVDTRNGTITDLPWLGHFSHEVTIIVLSSSGRMVAITTEDAEPGESQLYMYVAESDSDLMAGRGRLHVFRADIPPTGPRTRTAAVAARSRIVTGRFVPIDPSPGTPVAKRPEELEILAERAGCLNFARLEDAAPDRERPDAFYFVDSGDDNWSDRVTGRPVTGNGRLYHMTLDPIDPTVVTRLEVILDGDEGDDLFRPDNLDTNERCVMIQEDPAVRGIHPARILRYDLGRRRLDPIAECAERDTRGRLLPKGTGGGWETTGIVDASEFFGDDAWLIAVQAHTHYSSPFGARGGGGQLLLLSGPDSESARRMRKEGEAKKN